MRRLINEKKSSKLKFSAEFVATTTDFGEAKKFFLRIHLSNRDLE